MPGITLEQAEAQLEAYLEASTAVATGQSYSIAGRSLTRANLAEIQQSIVFWDNQVKRLTAGGGIRISRAVPKSKE